MNDFWHLLKSLPITFPFLGAYIYERATVEQPVMATKSVGRKPKMIVFDLDYTLWPFWVDTHVDPPFQKRKSGEVVDRHGRLVKPYSEVPRILERLHSEGYIISVASRTSCIHEANSLIELFDWNKYFSYKEIYPGCKLTHFNKFKQNSGLAFEDMLFFDDEYRNI